MMEKIELKQMRRGRMSKCEQFREFSAKIARIFALFGVPLIFMNVMVFVIAIAYVVRPHFLTRDFTRTMCEVTGYSIINESISSCSAGTDPFEPCLRIDVTYGTEERYHRGVIMENEQALIICNRCSYTFGKHGLLHRYEDDCNSWRDDFDPYTCVESFVAKHAIPGVTFPCYFNPSMPSEVFRSFVTDSNSVIHAIAWPILFTLIYFLALGFVHYDSKQAKVLEDYIRAEIERKQKQQNAERLRAQEWRKQKLGQSLGVKTSAADVASGISLRSPAVMKRSESVPSLSKYNVKVLHENGAVENVNNPDSDESNLDLRHLDLAVTPRNISDLTITYSYMKNPSPMTCENKSADQFRDVNDCSVDLSDSAISVRKPSSSIKSRRRKSSAVLFLRDVDYSFPPNQKKTHANISSRSFTNEATFFRNKRVMTQPQNAFAINEHEIDGYYYVNRKRNLFYSNSPTTHQVDMLSGEKEYRV